MIIGIDYGAKLAGTTVAACLGPNQQVELFASVKKQDADAFLLHVVNKKQPDLIAMDAPLSLPQVYANPNESEDYFYRQCDKEMQAMSPMFLGGLTARAMKLGRVWKEKGIQVIETYPAAQARRLEWDKRVYKKNMEKLFELTKSLTDDFGWKLTQEVSNWHHLDALLALAGGVRTQKGAASIYGLEKEGLIYV